LTEQNKILNFLADLENNSLKTEGCYFDKEVEQKIVNLQYSQLQGSQISTELNHQLALVKELRQALLSEAMQGKLVPQDERDESAEILLKKIRAEKEKLVAKKRIKRDKPLPPIKPEEIPFEIPSNWTWCRLGILGICQTGTTPSTAEKDNFGDFIPFIKPADISLKGINYHNEGLSEKGLKSGVLVQEDSLLMVCIGGSIGKSYFNEIAVSCNQQINIIKPLSKIGSQFLQYWLQSDYFQDSIWNKASGGTTPIVNRSKWESIFIPLPPLAEQERIFAKLEKLMKFCGELEANIKQGIINADKLMQTALKEVLEPKESVLAA
jgi:type I restriction enzyme S subunit